MVKLLVLLLPKFVLDVYVNVFSNNTLGNLAPYHNATTTMLNSWFGLLRFKSPIVIHPEIPLIVELVYHNVCHCIGAICLSKYYSWSIYILEPIKYNFLLHIDIFSD